MSTKEYPKDARDLWLTECRGIIILDPTRVIIPSVVPRVSDIPSIRKEVDSWKKEFEKVHVKYHKARRPSRISSSIAIFSSLIR